MNRKSTLLDLLIGAMMQLNPRDGERQNVVAFIESCFGGRVRSYDLDAAMAALIRLTDEEQHVLIEWVLHNGSVQAQAPSAA
jgi:hypothetical protein